MKTQKGIGLSSYQPDGFIKKYQKLVKDTVIPYQYNVLCGNAPDTEKSHVIQNFINAAKALKGEDTGDGFYGMVFQDSDAAKWIEAAAYTLAVFPDKELEKTADSLIDIIAEAQDSSGYLNTSFTVTDMDKRWTNLLEAHELYCSGHFMEAACAYYTATGKDKLLKVMLKNARHIYEHFIAGGHRGCPGHPEIELALLKMYSTTGDKQCLELAEHFINIRGTDPHFYEEEAAKRSWTVWNSDPSDNVYRQADKPVRQQTDARGHAVRAVYLYTAMADLASRNDDKELFKACRNLWESITRRQMYITGGIGSTVIGEAFSVDYDLPPDTAYAETCASIGLMFFASRMLENELDGEYADVMEQAFYNTVLAGMQLDGKKFFYVNPLEIVPGISGVSPTHRHDLPQRPGWYACACCPPNTARLIASFGQYAYGENENTAFCHMFAAGTVRFRNGMEIECDTQYPYGFDVTYKVKKGGRLAVRIPSWSRNTSVSLNSREVPLHTAKGYAYFDASDGSVLSITLDGNVRRMYPSSKIPAVSGKTALCRGPLVYCFEGADNDGDVLSLALSDSGSIGISEYDETLLGGTVKISAEGIRRISSSALYSDTAPEERPYTAEAVPYFTWGNRGEGQMRVWMDTVI